MEVDGVISNRDAAGELRAKREAPALHRSDDLLVRSLHVRAVREEAREADFICSTDTIDAYEERVEQIWDLKRYLANPTVLWAHDMWELPIGQAKNVGVIDGMLQATIAFGSEKSNPQAERAWLCVKEKTLRTVSVGFRSNTIRFEKEDGREILVLSDNDLYEISLAPVPANPECVARVRAKAIEALRVKQSHPAARGEEGTDMSIEKEQAALNEKLLTREAEIRTLEKTLADARAETVAVTKQLADTKAALETKLTELGVAHVAAVASAKEASDRATKAEGELLEKSVDELVGKKILPTQKAAFLAIAQTNKKLFDELISTTPDLSLLGAPIVGKDPIATNDHATPGDLATEITKAANAA